MDVDHSWAAQIGKSYDDAMAAYRMITKMLDVHGDIAIGYDGKEYTVSIHKGLRLRTHAASPSLLSALQMLPERQEV